MRHELPQAGMGPPILIGPTQNEGPPSWFYDYLHLELNSRLQNLGIAPTLLPHGELWVSHLLQILDL